MLCLLSSLAHPVHCRSAAFKENDNLNLKHFESSDDWENFQEFESLSAFCAFQC